MKKILLSLLTILLFTACQKQISTDNATEEIAGASANKQTKITICHYDAVTGTSKTIEVTQNALAGHLAHGDYLGECSSVASVTICDQVWMVKNLDVDHYRNGDPIPQVTNGAEWCSATTGAWCWYENNSANGTVYGKLYNWFAVNDPRGLAPAGWHVASDGEWTILTDCLGGSSVAGGKIKEAGTDHWVSPNTDATNFSGFTALPGGSRGFDDGGLFGDLGYTGNWWSSTEANADRAYARSLTTFNGIIFRHDPDDKNVGYSVRCVKD
jgi:uncharacterized protein (TIGR02145 family)